MARQRLRLLVFVLFRRRRLRVFLSDSCLGLSQVLVGARRRDGVLLLGLVDSRHNLQVIGRGFASAQIEAEKLGVLIALGEEEDGRAIRRPRAVVLAALVGGRRKRELASLVRAGRDRHNPEMRFGAVGGRSVTVKSACFPSGESWGAEMDLMWRRSSLVGKCGVEVC